MAIKYVYRVCFNCNAGRNITLVDGAPKSLETGCNICGGVGYRLWGFTYNKKIDEE